MLILYLITAVLVGVSLLVDARKTGRALRIARRRFLKTAPAFVVMPALVSVILHLLPDHLLLAVLSPDRNGLGLASALGLGSVSIMPGFVAFPLCGILLQRGALYIVLAFVSAGGICRIPMTLSEASFLGWRFTAVRFAVSLPLVLASSAVLGAWFERRGYGLPEVDKLDAAAHQAGCRTGGERWIKAGTVAHPLSDPSAC